MSEQEIYKWFIVHVSYHNESNVQRLLEIAGLEYYMPFKTVVRTWNNLAKEITVPVLPSCAFVRVEQTDVVMLQMMNELSLMVDSHNTRLSLSNEEMEALRQKLDTAENPGEIVLQWIEQIAR